ncbi:MAG: hypothetical protein GY694_20045 [Gammaproteobacteria bacterium]|nr:hypothetical protein [Gammaproteobacteria bacterium]
MTKFLLVESFLKAKATLVSQFEDIVEEVLWSAILETTQRDQEEFIWKNVLNMAILLMSNSLSLMCCKATEEELEERGVDRKYIRLRNDKDYRKEMMTTFGPVPFFSFAYRDSSSQVAVVTKTPAREKVFPLLRKCRSSELCLEWQARLGSEHPFRYAQEALTYFTHGAVKMEDTTIADHMVNLSQLVDREWLYKSPEEIREIVSNRATIDKETGKPIIHVSTDAHALKRYIDATWDAHWKMANGLRLWCVDRHNGAIIHLGGEYTWGDCHKVAEIMDWLISHGHLPANGDYGNGLKALITIVTDGVRWIEDHILTKFSNALPILDAYHAMEHLMEYANKCYKKHSKNARAFYNRCLRILLGKRQAKQAKTRRKIKDNKTHKEDISQKPEKTSPGTASSPQKSSKNGVESLLEMLRSLKEKVPSSYKEDYDNLVNYIAHNAYRMNYIEYRKRGCQIGSGAMESLHRSGSQKRLKIPGARWLPETSQAIFNLRMLYLAGRWNEFWHQPDFQQQLVKAFNTKVYNHGVISTEAA